MSDIELREWVERLIRHERELVDAHFQSLAAAVSKAEEANDTRLHAMNEFRQLIETMLGDLIRKQDLTAVEEKFDIRLSRLEKAESIMTGKAAMIWVAVVIGLGLLGAGFTVFRP